MTFNRLVDLVTESSAVRNYSCLMLDCSFLIEDIEAIQENICPCDIYESSGHGLEDDAHITVLYGIHSDKFSDVLPKIDLTPCTFKLRGLSLFRNDKYDVLKFDIISNDLKQLNKQCCETLEYTNLYPTYVPHMTVAYLKPGAGKKYAKYKSDIIGHTWESDVFIFSNQNSDKIFHRC